MAVVCAFDFSPYSIEALTAAAALARSLGRDLSAIHVHDALGAEIDTAAVARRRDQLRVELSRIGADPEVAHVVPGATIEGVLTHAERVVGQLVVIGAHGVGRSPVLGSVAAALATKSNVPVLVVRSSSPICAAAARKSELRTDVAFGDEPASVAAFNWASALALAIPAIVRRVRVVEPDEVLDPAIQAISDGLPLAEAIAVRAVRDGAGLVVVGRSERHGLERLRRPTLRAMLEKVTTNVACVPEAFVANGPAF